MKKCSKCKLPKTRSDFYRSRKATDGLQSRCIECVKESNARHAKTQAFKKSLQKYHNSPRGKVAKRRAQQRYERTVKGKITNLKYRKKS